MSTSDVLITILNGTKVLDSGTGIVLCHFTHQTENTIPAAKNQASAKGTENPDSNEAEELVPAETKTYVLTCAHNLRAIRAAQQDPTRILVGGALAHANEDEDLARLDLAVLTVQGKVGVRCTVDLLGRKTAPTKVRCEGYTGFFQDHFERRQVQGKIADIIATLTPDGIPISYLKIVSNRVGAKFKKGLSGAPVYGATGDQNGKVIGVARILDASTKDGLTGFAIQLTNPILSLIQEKIPCDIDGGTEDGNRPPAPPSPDPESVANNDIQKNRWGGSSQDYGRRLTVDNVVEYSRYFVFDAVLEATDQYPLKPPFVFHLHDTFARSVYWIRKTNGFRAALEEIDAEGTFTIGVQFKDGFGNWKSLEYDLAKYKDGYLWKKYETRYKQKYGKK
jgi:hypothetical protein